MEDHKIRWTKEEDDLLIQNIRAETWELAELFPRRTLTAIKTRKRELRERGLAEHPRARKKAMEHLHNEKTCAIPETIKEMVEQKKHEVGTFKDVPQKDYTIKAEPPQPILTDELTRLRNRVSYLEGLVDGMKYILSLKGEGKSNA